MKKLFIVAFLTIVALVGCGTTEKEPVQNAGANEDTNVNAAQQAESKTLLLYKSDAQAESTMPFEVSYTGDDSGLVSFIFNNVNEHDVVLLDFNVENENKSLTLNLGDDIFSIQGSAGATMFVQTLVKSYFENYPELEDVKFLYKGSDEPVLDHMEIGKAYTRAEVSM